MIIPGRIWVAGIAMSQFFSLILFAGEVICSPQTSEWNIHFGLLAKPFDMKLHFTACW
jgi:hypothetical protein